MLKKLIAPLQQILLQKHICPGCTCNLNKAKLREQITKNNEKVTCKCGRVFLYDKELGTYRRASEDEI